jgi:hypothetical protein
MIGCGGGSAEGSLRESFTIAAAETSACR